MQQFSTMIDTTYSQFRMILGDFDYPSMEAADRILGPIWFVSFIFFIFFILMVSWDLAQPRKDFFLFQQKNSKWHRTILIPQSSLITTHESFLLPKPSLSNYYHIK
jgi:hypothetical protein